VSIISVSAPKKGSFFMRKSSIMCSAGVSNITEKGRKRWTQIYGGGERRREFIPARNCAALLLSYVQGGNINLDKV